MFGSIFRLFMDVVRKAKEENKKEDPSTKPQDKNDGVFDVVDTPKVDEFEPSVTPETTEPIVTEPVITEPVVTEPVVTEPVVTEPVITEPVVTEPVVTEPVVTEPQGPIYDENGYDENGYDKDGYDENGYDKNGYDRDGYDKDGYKENGLDKDGYDRDGYNVIGYDREGYNKEGYDINGFDRNGFDVNGFDKNGYDKNGFNQEGFDVNGYDKNGFNKEGFNKEGFDKNGYNKEGYDKEGYDVNGLDKDGFNKEGWKNEVVENKDENGKLLSKIAVKTNKEGERVVEITTYSQDGKVASVSIEKYSEDGKILSKEVKKFDANNKVISTITEKFDDKGRKLSSIEKRADGTKTEKTYEYNDKNVCYETIYNYNKNGKASDLTYNHYDKNGNLTFNRKTTYKYSSSGTLESYTSVATRNGKTITDKYDKNGKLISTTETLPAINKGKWYKPTKEYLLYKMLPFGNSEYKTAASMYGKNAAGLLALAGGKTTDFNKQITRTINSYKDANISGIDCAPYLSEKLHEQFDFDYGCDISKMKGYYFGPNTQFSKDIAANSNFRNYVLKNKDKLLNNVSPDKPQGYQFKSSDNQDLYLAFSWADIIECWQDKDGAIHLLVADTYDFNKTDGGSLSKVGYRAMREGTLKPFYTINEVVIKP